MRLVREVASFMQMFPGYKLRDVLDEYAISFFALLADGYRLRTAHYLMLAQVDMMPHMEDKDRRAVLKQLEWAAQHPDDILKSNGEGSSPAEIKKMLQG